MSERRILPMRPEADPYFRWRGGEVSRIEGLSDGVFGLAVALLALAGTVPRHYDELVQLFRELPAFTLCFAFILWIWWLHCKFFRRFGAQDIWTVVLNSVLLLLVLEFVFPLRFLASWLVTGPLFYGGIARTVEGGQLVSMGNGPAMMPLYAGTFTAIFVIFALLYWNAYRYRATLELDEVEAVIVRCEIGQHLMTVSIGVASLVLAASGQRAWAGLVFFVMGPAYGVLGYRQGMLVERAAKRRESATGS